MRRRDPVKRSFLAGIGVVSVMVVWSASLWVKALAYNSEISGLEKIMEKNASQHKEVMNNLSQIKEIDGKLTSLDKLSANRFLVANLLNALQQTTLDDVQLSRLSLNDDLTLNEEIKAGSGKTPRAASVTEKIVLTLDARDSCARPGDLIPKFQQKIAAAPYFDAILKKGDQDRVHLKEGSYGALQTGVDNRQFQPFALECRFKENTR